MFKSTTELKAMDIFRHLNGKAFQVVSVTWVGGDNYKVACLDKFNKAVSFPATVHTSFEIMFTYSKAGA
jgi:hypothetical protein